jgi:putative NADPH-quinone reductase
MTQRICLIQGHPDRNPQHFGHALAQAYVEGARSAGHEVRTVTVAELDFPILRDPADFPDAPPTDIAAAQALISWSSHVVIIFPLWLGDMPALLKGFFEQTLRPGFAMPKDGAGGPWTGMLKGRSARIIVTMGMPGFFYRWFYRAHSLKSLARNILLFVGIRPVRSTVIGLVEQNAARRERWLARIAALGRSGR